MEIIVRNGSVNCKMVIETFNRVHTYFVPESDYWFNLCRDGHGASSKLDH